MKDELFTFHKTVHGYRHIQEGNPCQDNSISFIEDNGNYQIIAIADGHGDPACHRSDRGSRFAVEIAKKCLVDFAEAIMSGELMFDYPRHRTESIQQLTNTIISKWNGAVRNDLLDTEVSEEDLKEADQYEEKYRRGERLEHLYGTTLIAALHVGKYLILIQQGDGRCDVFYDDGSVNQPIPWDERCEGATTTSMCDNDAYNRIRSKIIDLEEKNVVACYIGSDGVEDSYYENEETQLGTHRFYMDITCKIHEIGVADFEMYLNDMLPSFSRSGSADDVSIAGIVNLVKTENLISGYALKVEKYDRKESLRKKYEEANSKVISMTRKHGILSEEVVKLEIEVEEKKKNHDSLIEDIEELKKHQEEMKKKVDQAKVELEEYQKDSKMATDNLKGKYSRLGTPIKQFFADITNGISDKEDSYRKQLEQLLRCEKTIECSEKSESKLKDEIEELERKLLDLKEEYEEYDNQFEAYKGDVKKYGDEISLLEDMD